MKDFTYFASDEDLQNFIKFKVQGERGGRKRRKREGEIDKKGGGRERGCCYNASSLCSFYCSDWLHHLQAIQYNEESLQKKS